MATDEPTGDVVARQRPYHGVDVGIILLDSDLPRPVGDIGNAETFAFPVAFDVADDVTPTGVVEGGSQGLYPALEESGRRLVDRGVKAVSTSCGFLASFQGELAAALGVPVATSSLLQVPQVLTLLGPDDLLAVVAINKTTLDDLDLDAVGITEAHRKRLVVVGMEGTEHFYRVITQGHGDLHLDTARQEVVAACRQAVDDEPRIRGFVFECTNLPPYTAAVKQATGLPVWDAISMVEWLRDGVSRH